jgi:glycosyltransferase involved in cell wall biosynthesis
MPTVSVVIRNRNEAVHLERVLRRLQEQRTPPLEVVVVDNDSTDGSRDLIRQYGARLVHLPAGQFTYGKATNLGFEHARGELVLMLSAHSVPIGTFFMDEVTAPFADARVAAVRIPIAANTAELRNFSKFAPLDQTSTLQEIYARGPVASGSVIRRSIWLRHRVDETLEAAEDKEWASRVLAEGGWIMPVANACYAYTKAFTHTGYLNKIRKEERAGARAAGLIPETDLPTLVKSTIVAFREAIWKVYSDWSLFYFRRGIRSSR